MISKFCAFFLLFMIYSNLGWLLEVVCKLIEKNKFVNRGFLIGPICPIYGFGSIIIVLFLTKFKNDALVLFFMSIIVCSLLEYFTSYFMEKIFHTRWWDYARRKYNFNGRICLETMIPFGVFGLLIVYILNPFFTSVISLIPNLCIILLSLFIFTLFFIDFIVSFYVIFKVRNTIKNVERDSTEEITNKVREILLSKNILSRRLVLAFPNFKTPYEYWLSVQKSLNDIINSLNKD